MVRRRPTVRFRKGAPGYADFLNIEPDTPPSGERHLSGTRYREGAWDQAFYGAMRCVERSRFGKGSLADSGARHSHSADLSLRRATRVVRSTPIGGNRTPTRARHDGTEPRARCGSEQPTRCATALTSPQAGKGCGAERHWGCGLVGRAGVSHMPGRWIGASGRWPRCPGLSVGHANCSLPCVWSDGAGGSGEALSEAVGVCEVWEVAACWPDGDGRLREHLAQPLLVFGF
jgi:hypothetical protein